MKNQGYLNLLIIFFAVIEEIKNYKPKDGNDGKGGRPGRAGS